MAFPASTRRLAREDRSAAGAASGAAAPPLVAPASVRGAPDPAAAGFCAGGSARVVDAGMIWPSFQATASTDRAANSASAGGVVRQDTYRDPPEVAKSVSSTGGVPSP